MAEAIGVAASIIQIAGAGAKLSTALYNFTSSAVRADQEIRDIAGDVELTSNALSSVGEVFKTEDAQSIVSKRAIQDANGIIKRCEEVFGEITEMVDKRRKVGEDGKKKVGFVGKIMWPMKEQRVELNRRRLESLKNSLVLFLHVLQLAQGQSRGNLERTAIEEERKTIRELHQRQQESLKSLLALESKFTNIALDDDETLKGSTESLPPPPPPPQTMFMAHATSLPPLEKRSTPKRENTITIDLSSTTDSDTSDSDATITDDEDTHLSIEELTKCAKHVQTLLKRITLLQQTFESTKKAKPHRKKHVHKIYRRFCQKFDSSIGVDRRIQRVHSIRNDVPFEPMMDFAPSSKTPADPQSVSSMFSIDTSNSPVLESFDFGSFPPSDSFTELNYIPGNRKQSVFDYAESTTEAEEQWLEAIDNDDDTIEAGVARKEDEAAKQGGNEDDAKAPSPSKDTSEMDHLLVRLRSRTVKRTSKPFPLYERLQSREIQVSTPVETEEPSDFLFKRQSRRRPRGMPESRYPSFTPSMVPKPPEGASEYPPRMSVPMPVSGSVISESTNSSANSNLQDGSLPQEEPDLAEIRNLLGSQGPSEEQWKIIEGLPPGAQKSFLAKLTASRRQQMQQLSMQQSAGSTMLIPSWGQQGMSSLQHAQMGPPTTKRPEMNMQTMIPGQSEDHGHAMLMAQAQARARAIQDHQSSRQMKDTPQPSFMMGQIGAQSPIPMQAQTGRQVQQQQLLQLQQQQQALRMRQMQQQMKQRQEMQQMQQMQQTQSSISQNQAGMQNPMNNQMSASLEYPPQPLDDQQMQLMLHEQQNIKRLLMARQEIDNQYIATPQENTALEDYQARLMELEARNKRRLLEARQNQDATTGAAQESPTKSQTLLPAPSPRDPGYTPTSGLAQSIKRGSTQEEEVDDQMHWEPLSENLSRPARKRGLKSATVSQDSQASKYDPAQIMEFEVQMEQGLAGSESSLSSPFPQRNRADAIPPGVESYRKAEQMDYQSQLMLLEQQNKDRLQMAIQEQEKSSKTSALTDYWSKLDLLLEQENKRRLQMVRQEQEESSRTAKRTDDQDYQSMLIHLEEQNKKRLEMARQEREESSKRNQTAAETSSSPKSWGIMPPCVNSESSREPSKRRTTGTKIKSAMIEDEDEDEDEEDDGLIIEFPDNRRESFEQDRAQSKLILSDEQNKETLEIVATTYLQRTFRYQSPTSGGLLQEQQESSARDQMAAETNSPSKPEIILTSDELPDRPREPRKRRYPANKIKSAEIIQDSDADSIMLDGEDIDEDEEALIMDFGDIPSEVDQDLQLSSPAAQWEALRAGGDHSFSDHPSGRIVNPAQELHIRTSDAKESSSDRNAGTRAPHSFSSFEEISYPEMPKNSEEEARPQPNQPPDWKIARRERTPHIDEVRPGDQTTQTLESDRAELLRQKLGSHDNTHSSENIHEEISADEGDEIRPALPRLANPRYSGRRNSIIHFERAEIMRQRVEEEINAQFSESVQDGMSHTDTTPALPRLADYAEDAATIPSSSRAAVTFANPNVDSQPHYYIARSSEGVQDNISVVRGRAMMRRSASRRRSKPRSDNNNFDSGYDPDPSAEIPLPLDYAEDAVSTSSSSQTADTSANPSVDPQPYHYNPRPQPFSDLKGGNVAMSTKRSRNEVNDHSRFTSPSTYLASGRNPDRGYTERSRKAIHGRLIQGQIVDDNHPSPAISATSHSTQRNRPPSEGNNDDIPANTTSFHKSTYAARYDVSKHSHALGGTYNAVSAPKEEGEDLKSLDWRDSYPFIYSKGRSFGADKPRKRVCPPDERPVRLRNSKRRKSVNEEIDVEIELGRRFVGDDMRRKSEDKEDIVDILLSQWTVVRA